MNTADKIFTLDFEIFGKVQGVFFRKHTEKQAKALGIKGWVMNTEEGSVKGVLEGEEMQLIKMKGWLKTKGSPKSRIDKAIFSEMMVIPQHKDRDFYIRK